jgi:hypothetical protein
MHGGVSQGTPSTGRVSMQNDSEGPLDCQEKWSVPNGWGVGGRYW